MSTNNIKGKVVVITGASSGFGAITARYLSEQGAAVALGARRTNRIEELAERINNNDGKAIAVTTDVTERKQVKNLVDRTVEKFGRVDVMLNNAGIMPQTPLENLRIDEWDQTIDVNIKGVLYGIAAVLPHMKEQQSGHIINVSSVAGHKVHRNSVVYSASKQAVRTISEGLRQEVKPYNMRTTIISPGAVDTELPSSVGDPDVAPQIQNFYENEAIPVDSFARTVAFAINQPEAMDVNEILYRPTQQEL